MRVMILAQIWEVSSLVSSCIDLGEQIEVTVLTFVTSAVVMLV